MIAYQSIENESNSEKQDFILQQSASAVEQINLFKASMISRKILVEAYKKNVGQLILPLFGTLYLEMS